MANRAALDRLRAAKIPKEKKAIQSLTRRVPLPARKRPIAKQSTRKRKDQYRQKKLVSADGLSPKEEWFRNCAIAMTGTCQCGCGEPSQKYSEHFRSSAAHLFPKRQFKSIQYHPLNWVERRAFAGRQGSSACHAVMDETSMNRWPGMADWEDIKAKFYLLSPLLTKKEKATKFYTQLEKLVIEN